MFSVHQPLYLRTQTQMTLSDTDEFWLSPLPQENATRSTNISAIATFNGTNGGDERYDSTTMPSTPSPSAHHQLLSHDTSSSTDLKGYDHTFGIIDYYDNVANNNDSGDDIDESSSFFRRPTLTEVKDQGGGSWLLGFVGATTPEHQEDTNLTTTIIPKDDHLTPTVIPGLVRVSSSDSESDSDNDDDDDSILPSSKNDGDNHKPTPRKGVSFSPNVHIQPIPHVSTLSSTQRRRMYSSSNEVRRNKIRNKKEYRYDGYDWRNVTEESEMGVDDVTGEVIHPVHEYEWR